MVKNRCYLLLAGSDEGNVYSGFFVINIMKSYVHKPHTSQIRGTTAATLNIEDFICSATLGLGIPERRRRRRILVFPGLPANILFQVIIPTYVLRRMWIRDSKR